jgi:8-hydroxy-5-deazaflavin:NADPH oxidoreductase
MNIGVIGTGQIGEVIIRKLRDPGYPVKMANSRGPESLKNLAANTGAIPVSVEQVVQDVDMLFIVVNQKTIPELPKGLLNKEKKKPLLLMLAIIIHFATAVSMK